MEFMREFPDNEVCLTYLWRTRYAPDGMHARCPRCETKRAFRRYETAQQRQSWSCTACGLHLHPTADTIFHKSSTALHLWFYAIYLITSTRCGISAKQLEREIGVGYKTAWRMFNLIRNSLMAETPAPLKGWVEMDETFFSKSRRLGMPVHSGLATDERSVSAMVERKGNVVARHVGGPTTLQVEPHIKEFVLPESTIFTDQSNIYQSLPKKGYQHRRINHSECIYGTGDVQTQTIEGFFSLLKNGIRGVYHSVSAKGLQSYLDEYAWRYNHREHTERGNGERRMPIGEAKFRLLLARAALTV
jgi:transposase